MVKLLVSLGFLARLLGWQPLLAGLVGFLLIMPLNIWSSKRYTGAQGHLMGIRDRKLRMLAEVLHGIRQIKFSAQENEWQARIGALRQAELDLQWWVFIYDIAIIFCWNIGPIALSAIALAVYAVMHGDLSASVAFTSITIFSTLETSLAIIPEFTAIGIEACVSLKRIEEYLRSPEKEDYVIAGPRIVMDKATISWHCNDTKKTPDRFKLGEMNLQIPDKELTVVCGPTGSGKSLLLTSLIGEAELLGGCLRVPKQPSARNKSDHIAHEGNWIIDSTIAFVAQTPWIENTSIRSNILFGLSMNEVRYGKVIDHCALKQDLEVLPDGDMTEIGFNGVNLSGGQKWRVSFARALYSRAGILVLDDLFR